MGNDHSPGCIKFEFQWIVSIEMTLSCSKSENPVTLKLVFWNGSTWLVNVIWYYLGGVLDSRLAFSAKENQIPNTHIVLSLHIDILFYFQSFVVWNDRDILNDDMFRYSDSFLKEWLHHQLKHPSWKQKGNVQQYKTLKEYDF